MGEKDSLTKKFMQNPEVFADAFNYLIYNGRQVIQPDELEELDTTNITVPRGAQGAGQPIQRIRDVFKRRVVMRDKKATYLLLGVENQSSIHYAMPIRNMMYDVMSYDEQIRKIARTHHGQAKKASTANDTSGEYLSGFRKSDRLDPVITLVIYFGDKEWDGPTTLHEMLNETDEEILRLTPDYKINLISPAAFTMPEMEKLQSELKAAMKFLKYLSDEEKLKEVVGQEPMFHSIEHDTAAMLKVLSDGNFEIPEGKEKVDMCVALQQMETKSEARGIAKGRAEGRAEGISLGRAEGISLGRAEGGLLMLFGLVKKGVLTLNQAAEEANMPVSEFKLQMEHLG